MKEIPTTIKEVTIRGFHSSLDAVLATWNKLPKVIRYTLGWMGFVGLVFAWCLGCAYVIFGLLGYNVATLILYYMVAMGVPFGIMYAGAEALGA